MHTNEYMLTQNPCAGAICLWAFANEFWSQRKRKIGPPIAVLTSVLPVVLHQDSVSAIHNRHFDGGLLNALADERSLTVGLQDRMERMFDQTFEALQMAFAAQLLLLNVENLTVTPQRVTIPPYESKGDLSKMVATASRLGYWFATMPLDQVCNYLRIRL